MKYPFLYFHYPDASYLSSRKLIWQGNVYQTSAVGVYVQIKLCIGTWYVKWMGGQPDSWRPEVGSRNKAQLWWFPPLPPQQSLGASKKIISIKPPNILLTAFDLFMFHSVSYLCSMVFMLPNSWRLLIFRTNTHKKTE